MNKLLTLTNSLSGRNHSQRRRKTVAKSQPEALEQRTMLSNVTVSFQGGDLRITGDADDNVVEVTQTPNTLIIEGHNGTMLNGRLQSLIFGTSRVNDDLIVNLQGGDNGLLLNNMEVGDDVNIKTGSGDDTVITDGTRIGDDMKIRSGSGNDVVFSVSDRVQDRIDINSGSGNDKVGVGGEFGTARSVKVNTSQGRDALFMGENRVRGLTDIKTGNGRDFIAFGESRFRDLKVNMGRGNDDMYVDDLTVDNSTNISGSGGTDSLEVAHANFGNQPSVSSVERGTVLGLQEQTLELFACIIDEISTDFPDYDL